MVDIETWLLAVCDSDGGISVIDTRKHKIVKEFGCCMSLMVGIVLERGLMLEWWSSIRIMIF